MRKKSTRKGHIHGKNLKGVVSEQKKLSIIGAVNSGIPVDDIAYFLQLPPLYVRRVSKNNHLYSDQRKAPLKRFFDGSTRYHLTYRDASQIFQAYDSGMPEEDIAYCLDGKQKMVRYTIEHRDEISPKITGLLDILFPGAVHDKPYILFG